MALYECNTYLKMSKQGGNCMCWESIHAVLTFRNCAQCLPAHFNYNSGIKQSHSRNIKTTLYNNWRIFPISCESINAVKTRIWYNASGSDLPPPLPLVVTNMDSQSVWLLWLVTHSLQEKNRLYYVEIFLSIMNTPTRKVPQAQDSWGVEAPE